MTSNSQHQFASAVRRLLADRQSANVAGSRSRPRANRVEARLRPSSAAMRRELELLRRG